MKIILSVCIIANIEISTSKKVFVIKLCLFEVMRQLLISVDFIGKLLCDNNEACNQKFHPYFLEKKSYSEKSAVTLNNNLDKFCVNP